LVARTGPEGPAGSRATAKPAADVPAQWAHATPSSPRERPVPIVLIANCGVQDSRTATRQKGDHWRGRLLQSFAVSL